MNAHTYACGGMLRIFLSDSMCPSVYRLSLLGLHSSLVYSLSTKGEKICLITFLVHNFNTHVEYFDFVILLIISAE